MYHYMSIRGMEDMMQSDGVVRRLLAEAIDRWGDDRQMIECCEKLGTLIQAICRRFDKGPGADDAGGREGRTRMRAALIYFFDNTERARPRVKLIDDEKACQQNRPHDNTEPSP